MLRELVLETLLALDEASHAKPREDLRVGDARVDEDRIVTSEDQVAPALRPRHLADLVRQHKETGLGLDVDQVEESDLVRHCSPFELVGEANIIEAAFDLVNSGTRDRRSGCADDVETVPTRGGSREVPV